MTVHATDTNWHYYTLVYDGASSRFRENGNEATGNPGADSLDGLVVAASNAGALPGEIDVADLVVLSDGISVADQTSWENYAVSRYGL